MTTENSNARILVRQEERLVPIVERAVHRSPALASRGLLIEHHVHETTEFPKRELQSHVIYLHTGLAVEAEIEGSGVAGKGWFRPGMVWVMPQGSEHAIRFRGQVEGIGVSFTPKLFNRLLTSVAAGMCRHLEERIVAERPQLEPLMRALWYEALDPTEPGLLTAECIGTALALTLARPRKRLEQDAAPGLTGHQLRAVFSFVNDHISEPLSLQSLANIAGLSPYHFLRVFKRSTGATPHQYVLQQRIEVAKRLLRENKHSLGEVASRVGFVHQSHFARTFRKYLGVTPGEFHRNS